MEKIKGVQFKKIEEPELKPEELHEIANNAMISEDNPPTASPCLLEMIADGYQQYSEAMTLGNISCIKAKAKSAKTFASTLFMSCITYNKTIKNVMFPKIEGSVLFLDTEQSEYHVYRTIQRVSSIFEQTKQSDNFAGFCLRPHAPDMRVKVIEYLLYFLSKKGLCYVVIDGIRDLVYDINDQREAVEITTKLMRWTKELNIHITVIIHENKATSDARGHIGTEIQNKCETVMSIKRDNKLFQLSCELTRNAPFKDVFFTIEWNGKCYVPVLSDMDYVQEQKQIDI